MKFYLCQQKSVKEGIKKDKNHLGMDASLHLM